MIYETYRLINMCGWGGITWKLQVWICDSKNHTYEYAGEC
jgi:hypothetical protein